jgi:hypothetical protein
MMQPKLQKRFFFFNEYRVYIFSQKIRGRKKKKTYIMENEEDIQLEGSDGQVRMCGHEWNYPN